LTRWDEKRLNRKKIEVEIQTWLKFKKLINFKDLIKLPVCLIDLFKDLIKFLFSFVNSIKNLIEEKSNLIV